MPSDGALTTQAADRIEQLEAAVEAQMREKHKEAAEAKLWFDKAQKWKAENAKLREALHKIRDCTAQHGGAATALKIIYQALKENDDA